MWKALIRLKNANRQTKVFVFMAALYIIAMVWTTVQAYVRLSYSRSDIVKPIVIQTTDKS